MHDFGYVSAETLEEALAVLEDVGIDARPLAGGTALIPQMRDQHLGSPYREKGKVQPSTLVSLRRVEELRKIKSNDAEWYLGAMTTLSSLAEPGAGIDIPAVALVASRVASPEVRNVATIGGNLCNASPAADLLAPLLALRARVHLVSVRGSRWIPVGELYRAPHRTALGKGEILAGIGVPLESISGLWGVASYATHPRMGMTLASAVCIIENPTSDLRGRVVVTPSIGRPIELSIDFTGNADKDGETVREMVEVALRKQLPKARGCHYSWENPQIPTWYVEYRTILAAQEAVRAALSGGAREETLAHED